MTPRVLVFFLDGGTWSLLRPGIERGLLPTMANMVSQGAHGILESVVPTETSFATAAFALGKHPAALGAFSASGSRERVVTSDQFPGKRIWEILGEYGFRSLVMDFPCTWPPRPFDGVLFTGFYTPEHAKDFAFPAAIAERYPSYPRGGIEMLKWLEADRATLLRKEYEITRERFEVFRDACQRENFSFGCFYVKETDILQHYFWDDQEELLKLWAFVDGLLAEALSDGWTHVLVASDHGFDEAPRTAFFTNRWLADEGFLKPRVFTGGRVGGIVRRFFGRHHALARLYYQTRHRLFGSRAAAERAALKADHLSEEYPGQGSVGGGIDLGRSDAYAPGGALHGKGIYLNRKRFPAGSAGWDAMRRKIMERLESVRFEGSPAFQRIMPGEEVYPSVEAREIPDIVIVPVPRLFVEDRLGDRTMGARETVSRALGHHLSSPDGIVLALGPGIPVCDLGRVSILDLFPTILQWYGLSAPGDINGRTIPGLAWGTITPVVQDQGVREALSSIKL